MYEKRGTSFSSSSLLLREVTTALSYTYYTEYYLRTYIKIPTTLCIYIETLIDLSNR